MDDVKLQEGVAAAPSGRLMDRLRGVWRDVAEQFGIARGLAPDLPPGDADALRSQMRDCLDAKGGEVSARAHAAVLGRSYLALNAEGRGRFLKILAEEFGTDPGKVDAAMAAVQAASKPMQRLKAEQILRETLESPRVKLLTHFNALPEGVKFLVDLRAELLTRSKGDAAMSALEAELRDLLAAWFDVGFLELRRITWRSPAIVLEKIIAYEAVHAVQSWQDLKNRLDSDRRFFAFFHPRMPDEPLIFVEVAWSRAWPHNVGELLDETAPVGDPGRADTAIFYSITNCPARARRHQLRQFPDQAGGRPSSAPSFRNLKSYATLSPVPGFRAWLDGRIGRGRRRIC